jgi:2',3'-cyclic-nucleotide 2'-phosphodiesterase (5'-nucleotidase family)
MKKTLVKGCTVLITLAVLVSLWPVALSAQPPMPRGTPPVKTAADKAMTKIEPSLRTRAAAGGEELISVSVVALPGTDVGKYMVESLTRPFVDAGEQTTFGKARAGSLLKLASLPEVSVVQPLVFGPNAVPPLPPDGHAREVPPLGAVRRRIEELKAIDVPWSAAAEAAGRPLPTDWFDVLDTHQSSQAWAKGYQGEGVRVAVADDSVDFAHPDLMGTQATVKDGGSPYYGWPMAFNPFSMLGYAYDQYLGYAYVADGATWYADTSATPVVVRTLQDLEDGTARLSYAPLAGSSGERSYEHEYVFNDTSQSGVYHIGSHPDEALLEVFGERVAVLVVDEGEEGVYDTVYVDVDNDYDFRDEKPVTRDSPISYRDMDGDGYADISGGMVYFIADGVNPLPIADWFWGLGQAGNGVRDFGEAGNGSLVAFHGALDGFTWDHGTLCASNVVGQGVINGGAPEHKPAYDGPGTGMVLGAAPKAEMVGISNIYFDFFNSILDAYIFSVYGYDGMRNTGDEMQVTSNSYGNSDIDNDGWDYNSRYVARRQRLHSPTTSFIYSTGNGAPGYGTTAPPSPPTAISVGASTQMGSTGWDSIASMDQITYNDVQSWSNRGPGARGTVGVHVVAQGAYGAGAVPLNTSGFDGWNAWETWGGTSRSAPVAMGNLALVYQAYKENGGAWPTYDVARQILMSGATNVHYDVFSQGAGSVNADRATDVAGGHGGVYVGPDNWTAGDYRGTQYGGFANIVHPGDAASQTFAIYNPSPRDVTVSLSDDVLVKTGEMEFGFTTDDISKEDEYEGREDPPQYIVRNVTEDIPVGTDLLVVRMRYDYADFDVDGDYDLDNNWWLLPYEWMDVNGDGEWWKDLNGNGVLNYGEMDPGEFVRFAHNGNDNTVKEVRVQRPLERMHDGILIGVIHDAATPAVPTTTLHFRLEFYQHSDWGMLSLSDSSLTVPAGGAATFDATVNVPADTAIGLYEGAILVDDPGFLYKLYFPIARNGSGMPGAAAAITQPSTLTPTNAHQTVVPVVVNVAAEFTGVLELGGAEAETPDLLYNNGVVGGHFTWNWRAESGDWRFFFFDVAAPPAPGTKLIVRDVWVDDSPPTDIDTLILGPTSDRFSDPDHPDNASFDWSEPDYYGPYTLDAVGSSPNRYIGSGKWRFNTATGGAEEWVTAPLQEGLHLVAQHNVLFSGQEFLVPFSKTVATVSVEPTELDIITPADSGSVPLTFISGIELAGLAADAFGLSAPEVLEDQLAFQDDPDDPATASYGYVFEVEHASSLAIRTRDAPAQDLDLFVYYDANDNGFFEHPGEVIGSSTTPTGEEFVSARLPADGWYMAAVHGWAVSPSPSTFTLVVDVTQGYDLTISGAPAGTIPANTPIVLNVSYNKAMAPGDTLVGEILLGPTAAPAALSIPVSIHRFAPTLTILHNNDGESDLLGDDDFGGVARFATVVDQVRTEVDESHPLLLVNSGDSFLAGPEWTASLEKGVPFYDSIALDLIGYDAMCIGNHDFDFGPDRLADFVGGFPMSQVPFLSANLDFTAEPRLQGLAGAGRIAGSVVVEAGGQEFGIVGATTPNLTFITSPRNVVVGQDVQAAVQAEIDALEAAGVNQIILISHLQAIGEDLALAPQLSGVDVMIAGGGDELLANPSDLIVPGGEVYGPYPIVVQNADGADVPVVTTAGQYKYLGRLAVTFDGAGTVLGFGGGPIRVAGGAQPDAVEPDAQVQAQVADPVAAYVAALSESVLATSEVPLDARRNLIRARETNEGNLIADSFLWKARKLHADYGAPAPDVAMSNGGGIRNDSVIPAGDVTELDTFDMLPFPNFLTVVPEVTPEDFQALLENAVSRINAAGESEGSGTGRFAQIAGFSFTYDSRLDAGSRVLEAALDDGTVMIESGEIALTARNVHVAIVDFLARGGDEYFGGPPGRSEFFILGTSYQQALADYIQAPAGEGGLGGLISAAQFPEGGEGRITNLVLGL